jgi:outer membrane protein assembly factor BamD
MKIFCHLVILFIIVTSISCTKEKKEISKIKEIDQLSEITTTYKEAIKSLDEGDAFYAAKKFLEVELLYPQSIWAPKAILMASYSYYIQDYYSEAIFNLERFVKTYPTDQRIDYVYYLLAMCHYENIEGEKKDLEPLLVAKNYFSILVEKYPSTDFAMDGKFKIGLINTILASKEMYLGKHYIKKKKWIPAINRFKIILKDYETTIYAEEALHRLVEIHYRIGLVDESKKYASLLGYNYLSGEWYKKSYKIFNKKYKTKEIEIKKEKKNLIKKFKKLF